MARGAPDYMVVTDGRTPERYFTYSLPELPLMLLDNFETTVIKWIYNDTTTLSLDSTAATTSKSSPVVSGDKCLKITGTANFSSTIQRYVGAKDVLTNIGISTYFYCMDWANMFAAGNTSVEIVGVRVFDSNYFKDFRIFYEPATYKWYYSNDGGDTAIEFATLMMSNTIVNYIKLFLDLENDEAKFVIINGIKYTFTNVSLQVGASSAISCIVLAMTFTSAAAKAGIIYLDDYTVTYNEPF